MKKPLSKSTGGWIKLHRKIMDTSEWLAEPFTRGQAWVDLLLLANHLPGHIRKRGILIHVGRGQVGYSVEALAKRWKWSRGKVYRFLSDLKTQSMISRKILEPSQSCVNSGFNEKSKKMGPKNETLTVPKNSTLNNLIYIENYDKYQAGGSDDSTDDSTDSGSEDGTRTRIIKNVKNTPDKIFEKISSLKSRYNPELIDRVFKALAQTRKSNRIADTVILAQLEKWAAYPTSQVENSIRVYLEKNFAADGKNEKYLMGIIRNGKPMTTTAPAVPNWY